MCSLQPGAGARALGLLALTAVAACGGTTPPEPVPPPPREPPATTPDAAVGPADAGSIVDASSLATAEPPIDAAPPPPAACPADMAHVQHDFCPRVTRSCLKAERNKPNKINICHRFKPGSTRCHAERVPLDFCIDKYEYPNREGGHPPWMVSWHDAEATCRHLGKRTCWDWEWEAACEGPDETPFPYGWERSSAKCNIDNLYISPNIRQGGIYSSNRDAAHRELSRLDQSVPSGAMPGCVSGYGVFDLTGNMDEWVTRYWRGDGRKSKWAGLKGGAWGHVRNACRPMTTSHVPEFTYYFITFRCCKDPEGAEPFVPPKSRRPPTVAPADRAPIPVPINPPGPSKKKVGRR